MMKRKIISVIIVLILGFILVLRLRGKGEVSLTNKISSYLNNSNNYEIISVEEMDINKPPIVVDIVRGTDKESIADVLDNSKIRFIRNEIGMEITSSLYTLTVSSDDLPISITVNNKNEIHFNSDETTYVITNGYDLYQELCSVFSNNTE